MRRCIWQGAVLAVVFIAGAMVGMPAAPATAAGEDATPRAVQDLVAREEIRKQIYNYGRGIDRLDKQLTLEVWHPDGTADYGGKVVNGRDWVEGLFKGLPNMTASAHHLLESRIEVDGDKATSETIANTSLMNPLEERLVQGVAAGSNGVSVSLIRGRYADRWSKRNGRWALDHRAYIEDFRTVQEVPGRARLGRGTRGRQDPSYAIVPF
jgi:hypothetical protein